MSFISLQAFRSNSESDMSENCVVLDAKAYQNEGNRRLKNYNDIKGAIEAYTKAIIISKSNYLYYNNRAAAYLLIHEDEKAITDCDASLDLCKNVKAYCRKASALGHQRKYNEGITQVLKALDMEPRDKESSQVLESLVKDKNMVHIPEEEDTPEGLANKKLNERLIQKRASDLCDEGKLYIKNNNFQAGIESFTMAITLCPSSYKYFNYRAIAYKINGDYKKTIHDCDKSWSLHKNIDAYNLKGSVLSKQKKYDDAIECIMLCLEIDPDHKESILLHEQISKDKQGRNRASTIALTKNVTTNNIKKLSTKGKLLRHMSEKGDLLKSPSKLISKIGSPKHSERDEDVPWYEVPTRHVRSSEAGVTKQGGVRILDKFEWQDLPVEYARVGVKIHDSRGTKAVRMKQLEKKVEVPSPVRDFFMNVYIVCAGALQRSVSTDAVRRASVSPEVKQRSRSRGGLTPVGV